MNLWTDLNPLFLRCPRCGARRLQACRAKGGGFCPIPHTARHNRFMRVQGRLWCLGCLRRGNAVSPRVNTYRCDEGHLHFLCRRCLDASAEFGYVSLSESADRITCIAANNQNLRVLMEAQDAMESLRRQR